MDPVHCLWASQRFAVTLSCPSNIARSVIQPGYQETTESHLTQKMCYAKRVRSDVLHIFYHSWMAYSRQQEEKKKICTNMSKPQALGWYDPVFPSFFFKFIESQGVRGYTADDADLQQYSIQGYFLTSRSTTLSVERCSCHRCSQPGAEHGFQTSRRPHMSC